jgi:hypothetical protein
MQLDKKGMLTKVISVERNGVMTFYNNVLSFDVDKLPQAS